MPWYWHFFDSIVDTAIELQKTLLCVSVSKFCTSKTYQGAAAAGVDTRPS